VQFHPTIPVHTLCNSAHILCTIPATKYNLQKFVQLTFPLVTIYVFEDTNLEIEFQIPQIQLYDRNQNPNSTPFPWILTKVYGR